MRKQHNLTQNELAAGLFVSRDLVAEWETGERRPDADAIRAMATLFGISPSQIESVEESIKEELAECISDKTDFTSDEYT